ncbi:hypothetical protein L1889_02815 [Paenalcaligenes niemegkensis]|uniref:hypothetical protein n=1 Tax=Paenalcaligenes niemegkensis TaxID=2895469 RepID=UPI001EE84315|nr:hypothetical protein [Paenalcaligenes niemegkensis]MCQ9615779.1 hypothetical protein [Paenalcaligenes niemegkensis]
MALDICVDTLGRDRMPSALLPEVIQKVRVGLIATRAVSTLNHYLATFSGVLYRCENIRYSGELGKHTVYGQWRDTESSRKLQRM